MKLKSTIVLALIASSALLLGIPRRAIATDVGTVDTDTTTTVEEEDEEETSSTEEDTSSDDSMAE